ncbi:MAG: hypothetical protein HND48_27150 [Chloroflexi bacterium]|nr:hypothetical protein [Chloroflexota bacterium]
MANRGMERFTQRARRVLGLAQEEAERLNHAHIGTEHLLGLLREKAVLRGACCANSDSIRAVSRNWSSR